LPVEIKFLPPELYSQDVDGIVDQLNDSSWQNAIKYHEQKNRLAPKKRVAIKAAAVRAIVQKALASMGAVSRPQQLVHEDWSQNQHAELDLESSLEADCHLQKLLVEKKEPRRAEVIVCLDTSLSMTGKKMAITAVAMAVMALQLEPEDLSIIAFETEATLVKALGTKWNVYKLVEKFMELPAKGLTNIEAGLKIALKESQKGKLNRKVVILMTDGRYTAGHNPEYLVSKLPRLYVVQTGSPWASVRFCRNLAKKGGGKFTRVSNIEDLPKALYSLVHEIIR
jgi:Mg-chelatase subunit ChlD